jgi:hypothetical protein
MFHEEYYLLDITPRSPVKVNRRFGGTYRHLLSHWFLARLIVRPWIWKPYVRPKRRLTFNGLHGVISQKTVLFISTAVWISNPTECFLFFTAIEQEGSSSSPHKPALTQSNDYTLFTVLLRRPPRQQDEAISARGDDWTGPHMSRPARCAVITILRL